MTETKRFYGNRVYRILLIWYLFSYFFDCVVSQYFQKYMEACGLNASRIGSVIAAGTAVSLLGQPLWARAADRSGYKNKILFVCNLGGAITVLLWYRAPAGVVFFFIFSVYIIFALFHSVVLSLSDTICLEILEKDGRPFGPVRLMGSIGWAVMSFIAGQILNKNIWLFGPLCGALALAATCSQFSVPKIKGHIPQKARTDLKSLFKNRGVLCLTVYLALTAFAGGFSGTYFYLNFAQLGGNASSYGTYLLIVTLTEIPFLFYADRILRKIGVRKMLAFVGVISFARQLYICLVPSYEWLFGLALVHGILVLNLFVTSVFFTRSASPETKASSLTAVTVIQAIFRAAGTYAGGLVISHVFNDSFQPAFLISSGILLIAVVFLLSSTAGIKFDTDS